MSEYLDYTGLSHFKDKLDLTYSSVGHTHSAMTGATSSVAGSSGLVPAPSSGDDTKFLRGDGTWAVLSGSGDVAITNAEIDAIVNGSSS